MCIRMCVNFLITLSPIISVSKNHIFDITQCIITDVRISCIPAECDGMKPEISGLFLDGQVPVVAVNETVTNLWISITCDIDFKCSEYSGPSAGNFGTFTIEIRDDLNICEEGEGYTFDNVRRLGSNIERYILSKKVPLQSPARFNYTCALKRHSCSCSDFTTTHLIVTESKSYIVLCILCIHSYYACLWHILYCAYKHT